MPEPITLYRYQDGTYIEASTNPSEPPSNLDQESEVQEDLDLPYRIVEGSIVGPTIAGMHSGMWHNSGGLAGLQVIKRELNAAYAAGHDDGHTDGYDDGRSDAAILATRDHSPPIPEEGEGHLAALKLLAKPDCAFCGGRGHLVMHERNGAGGGSNVDRVCSCLSNRPVRPLSEGGE